MAANVTVITGTYNSARYLDRYFASLDAQTYRDWEAILVDDGSTDETVARIEAKCAADPRYKLVRKKPEGYPSRSRAVGLAAVTTKYVAFCDHDDFWAPEKLALQMQVLSTRSGIAILHTDRVVWRTLDAPATPYHWGGNLAELPVTKQRPEDVIYQGLQILFSSFVGETAMVRTVGFHPEMRGVDDFYLFVRLAALGDIVRIDLPLSYYYAHTGNLSHANNIFVEGFYKVHQALLNDPVPDVAKRSLYAQASRTEAVSLLATDRPKALRLLVRSLRAYYIPSTLNRLVFLLATFFIPLPLQRVLMRNVKRLKFAVPTFKDLLR